MARVDPVARRAGVTRADVARLAGVSTAVVSYVVNGGPRPVSDATASRVRDAIDRLGYRPNTTARALAVGATKTLGLVVPDSTNPFFAEYAWQIQRAATRLGYAVLITNTGFDPVAEERYALDLHDRQIDGLLLAGASGLRELAGLSRRGHRVPVVLIDAPTPLHDYTTVGADSTGGTRRVVEHLIDVHGHESVALIIGDSADPAVDGRERGWTEAHARAGRRLGVVEHTPFSRQGGYEAGMRLLRREERPSAVFVSADIQAVGFLRAAHELEVSVPGEVAVGSFDDSEESRFCWPPLTTAQQPVRAMAEAAIEAVLRADSAVEHLQFDMPLVVRGSCGCPTG
jgi:LacI family transcriptional regulator